MKADEKPDRAAESPCAHCGTRNLHTVPACYFCGRRLPWHDAVLQMRRGEPVTIPAPPEYHPPPTEAFPDRVMEAAGQMREAAGGWVTQQGVLYGCLALIVVLLVVGVFLISIFSGIA